MNQNEDNLHQTKYIYIYTHIIQTRTNTVYKFLYSVSESLYKLKHIKSVSFIKHCLALLCRAQNQHPGKNII